MDGTLGAPLTNALIVPKEKNAANKDYNLSGERYRETKANHSTFPLVALEELFTKIGNGVHVTQVDEKAKYRVTRIQTIADASVDLEKTKFTDDEVKPESFLKFGDILLSHINSYDHLGKSAIFLGNDKDVIHGINLIRLVPDTSRIDPRFASRVFKTGRFIDTVKSFAQKAVNQASVKTSDLGAIQIPLPPLEVQKEIVAEIEAYQKVINGARAVLDHYRPHIPIHPDWPMVRLADLCESISDGDHQPPPKVIEGVPFVTISNISDNQELEFTKTFFVPESYYENLKPMRKPRKGDILYTVTGSYGVPVIVPSDRRFCFQRHIAIIRTSHELNSVYLHSLLSSPFMLKQAHEAATGVAQKTISLNSLRNFKIPLPPLTTQQAIVAEIEAEQSLVAANSELITRFEQKIQTTLARIWGEEKEKESNQIP